MNKIEVGMYVRTKDGIIDKVIIDYNGHCANPNCKYKHISCAKNYYDEDDIKKASFNIIDLIEVGDILLLFDKEYGKEYKAEVVVDNENFTVVVNYEQNDLLILEYELITNEHIELLKILTKEQFESMSYRIGE